MLGSVGGRFQGLDVMTALYLGGVPLDVAGAAERDTGIANGFVGENRSEMRDSFRINSDLTPIFFLRNSASQWIVLTRFEGWRGMGRYFLGTFIE